MPDINELVVNEMIGIRIRPVGDHELGPNSKVEAKNLGMPEIDTNPKGEPDFYKNFSGGNLSVEKTDSDVPTDLSTGIDAGERLKKAIKTKQTQSK